MNTEILFLFLVLLLSLVLCSFLGGNCGTEGFAGNFSETFTTVQPNNGNNRNNSNSNNNMNNSTPTNGASTSSSVNYDNYNHYSGQSTKLVNGTTFYGENGGSVVVNTNSNGSQELKITLKKGDSPIIFKSTPPTTAAKPATTTPATTTTTPAKPATTTPATTTPATTTPATTTTPSSVTKKEWYTNRYTNYSGNNGSFTKFYGPNGETATVVRISNGLKINVLTSSGYYTYTQSGTQQNSNTMSSTQYYGSTGSPIQTSATSSAYQGSSGGSAGAVTGPQGNSAYYAQGPQGNAVAGTTNSSSGYGNTYYSTLPPGVPQSQIPTGQEDLYILKSQIVPPVCPVCITGSAASSSTSGSNSTTNSGPSTSTSGNNPSDSPKCPPCPPCARCPESNFDCKKVPNYSAINNQYLPMPILNDFSTFGM